MGSRKTAAPPPSGPPSLPPLNRLEAELHLFQIVSSQVADCDELERALPAERSRTGDLSRHWIFGHGEGLIGRAAICIADECSRRQVHPLNTVWMTGDPTADKIGNASQYKPVVFSGGSTTNLTAPSSGTYKGILFFQDRNICSVAANNCGPASQQNTISGGSGAVFSGALYFSNTPLVFSGGSNVDPENVDLIADTIAITGGSTVGSPSGPAFTPPVTASRLYE